jgi:hypothetical protein
MVDMNIQVAIDKAATARLTAAIAEIQKHTGRSVYQSVMFASVKVCQSGRHDSKPGLKKRKIRPDPLAARGRGMKKSQMGGLVDILSQRKAPRVARVSGPSDPLVVIKRHGLAKRLWNIMAAKAASTKSGTALAFSKWYSFTVRPKADEVVATMRSKLTYLQTAYPGQEARIATKGAIALEMDVDRKLGIIIDRANKAA